VRQLTERWNIAPELLERYLTLDFRSPTVFSLGRDPATQEQRYRSQPDPRTVFSALRKRWVSLGGFDAGDEFDAWVGKSVEAAVQRVQMRRVWVEQHWVQGFMGTVRFEVYGAELRWLPYVYLLADLAFWTGVGYQTTRGMGQVRPILPGSPPSL
jgi:CRISPR-associated endoribonuclease Cas6